MRITYVACSFLECGIPVLAELKIFLTVRYILSFLIDGREKLQHDIVQEIRHLL